MHKVVFWVTINVLDFSSYLSQTAKVGAVKINFEIDKLRPIVSYFGGSREEELVVNRLNWSKLAFSLILLISFFRTPDAAGQAATGRHFVSGQNQSQNTFYTLEWTTDGVNLYPYYRMWTYASGNPQSITASAAQLRSQHSTSGTAYGPYVPPPATAPQAGYWYVGIPHGSSLLLTNAPFPTNAHQPKSYDQTQIGIGKRIEALEAKVNKISASIEANRNRLTSNDSRLQQSERVLKVTEESIGEIRRILESKRASGRETK